MEVAVSDRELDRVASALGRLLRTDDEETGGSGSSPDAQAGGDRSLPLAEVARRLSFRLGKPIDEETVRRAAQRGKRFEIRDGAVRARPEPRRDPGHGPPDILYHACTADQVQQYLGEGLLRSSGGQRPIFLSDDETQAWRAAHRMNGEPRVLYVDTARQRRRKLHLQRNRRGLWYARQVPLADVLNLRPEFAEQISAGGIPVALGPDGQPRMALIRVTRRSGVTWEVAKGKLEPGEPPEWAGVREVKEEMGIPQVDFEVKGLVGLVRYGFLAPGGLPRLKTVFLYLLEPRGDMDGQFAPATREGIRDVRWFTPEEACRAVTHSSLRPIMRRARRLTEQLELARSMG